MFVYAKQTILFKHRINGWIPNWENVIIFLDLQSNEPGSAFTLQICTLQANKHNFFSFQIYVRNAPNEQWACNWFEVSTWMRKRCSIRVAWKSLSFLRRNQNVNSCVAAAAVELAGTSMKVWTILPVCAHAIQCNGSNRVIRSKLHCIQMHKTSKVSFF